ncbi:MAG TPA: tRNA pseudouridine(38-40) synthase TruA [Chlamydiales bacterium]|nr:tRNA pseudouridine(38-40) synthase TruA [Chlamydiales bacterium]
MNRYKIVISYDGTHYAGWQVQKTGLAIQPVIQKAIETFIRHPIQLSASGRTDTGVHALGQVAHFDCNELLDSHRFLYSLNALLPADIRILQIEKTKPDFHARYSAISKIYHYHLHLDEMVDPFTRLYSYHVFFPCDLNLLFSATREFLGEHDFTSFASKAHQGAASYDPIRTLHRLDIVPETKGIRLEFEADGFLYRMVRNITGTLLDVARGKINPSEIREILLSKDRKKAGQIAPPHGLFLMEVKYQ